MGKTIQVKNTNILKKDKNFNPSKIYNINFSLIVPLVNSIEALNRWIETMRKLKQENYSKIELVLIDYSNDNKLLNNIEQEQFYKDLLSRNSVKVIKEENVRSKSKAIEKGIANAAFETVCVFDYENLTGTFNINDFFGLKKDISGKIGVPVFQSKDKKEDKINLSVLLGEKNLMGYLFSNVCKNSSDYHYAVKYQLKQADIEIEKIPIAQANPFRTAAKQNLIHRSYKNFLNRINWFFIIPAKEIMTKVNRDNLPLKLREASIYRLLFALVAIVSFIAMPMMAYHTGNSGDEDNYQYPQAVKIFNYYASFGKDTSYKEVQGMESYGMSFDTFTVAVIKLFKIDNIFEARHAMNAIVGWLAILFCGLLAYRIANWRAALITFIFMFFSPQFLGQSFNNPKDIPFAMAYIFTIYYIVRFLQQFPKISHKTTLYVALGIAMAISVRIGGLLLIAYLLLFFGIYFLYTSSLKGLFSTDNINRLKKLIIYTIIISVLGYFAGLILWPYALEAPISNPIKALGFMSNFTASLRQIFEGVSIWSDKVPWYYTIKYILITSPIAVIIGSVVYIFFLKNKDKQPLWAFILLFSFGFPIFYIIWKNSNVYGGWRHVLFTYPTLVVAAGLGFNSLIDLFKNKYLKIIVAVIMGILMINPILHTFRNHPYEYVYFNEFAGGVKKAYGKYETDYYFHSLKEATEWVKKNAVRDENTGKKIKVAAWLTSPVSYYLRKDTANFEVVFVRFYERGNNDWDYAIFVNTGINPAQLQNGSFPPKNTVYTVNVDGKPICAVLKRTDKSDYLGSQALEKGDIQTAIPLLKKAADIVPTNEAALLNLADAYIKIQQLDSAMIYINRILSFDPELDNALNFKAYIYLAKNDFDNSLATAKRIIKNNYKYYFAYWWAANAYIRKNDSFNAIKMLEQLLQQNQAFKPAYQMLAQIYQQQGDEAKAQYYMNVAQQLQ